MPSIQLSEDLFGRLKSLAEPFVDTPETVIARLIDAHSVSPKSQLSGATVYDAGSPPNLTHTKVTGITLDGRQLPNREAYWNYLLFALVRLAGERGLRPEEIRALTQVNSVVGKKGDAGYRFIPEAGISVQGQDAVGAWRGIVSLAEGLDVSVSVDFEWLQNPRAANPGQRGRLSVPAPKGITG